QAVSGTGQKAVDELDRQVRRMFNMEEPEVAVYPHRIAFNCLPHIDVFLENGYTKEEMKMVNETVKIMEDPNIRVTATTVRVPVFYAHSEALNVEFDRPVSVAEARDALEKAEGVVVLDDPARKLYPMPKDAAGRDEVFAGRIRRDESLDTALNMWVVGDNVRKGAALNAVQIAECLVREGLVRVADRGAFLR
ncbi:MAG: aspartate-semialdehyde dehydrogenase, partial [Desulfovibrio sp.]|nr:aspartate-semialdehyde dehydrogenase [Desulfovibrio sp.]